MGEYISVLCDVRALQVKSALVERICHTVHLVGKSQTPPQTKPSCLCALIHIWQNL